MPESPPQTTGSPAVSVLIVVYDAGPHLQACLDALGAQSRDDFEAIVWDNASNDGAFAVARAANADPRFRFVQGGANLGFAAGNNAAAKLARAPWLAFLNPDAFAAPDWLETLLAAAARHPETQAFACLQLDAGDPTRLDGAGDVLSAAGIPWRGAYGQAAGRIGGGEVFSACGAAALYRTERFQALGGFAEDFFCFCEDVDLGFRHRLAGGRCLLLPESVVRHVGGASAGRRSAFAVYHGARNRLWLYARCMPGPLFWPVLPLHLLATALLFLQAALGGQGGAFARGLRDAFAARARVLAERRVIQSGRRANLTQIARALCWSPRAALRRDAHIR